MLQYNYQTDVCLLLERIMGNSQWKMPNILSQLYRIFVFELSYPYLTYHLCFNGDHNSITEMITQIWSILFSAWHFQSSTIKSTMDQTWRFIHIILFTKLMRMVVIWNNFVQETSFMKIYQKCRVISCTGNFIHENLQKVELFHIWNFIWKVSHLFHHLF